MKLKKLIKNFLITKKTLTGYISEAISSKKYREGIVTFLAAVDYYKNRHPYFSISLGKGEMSCKLVFSEDCLEHIILNLLDKDYFSHSLICLSLDSNVRKTYGIHSESCTEDAYIRAILHELGHATAALLWPEWSDNFQLEFTKLFNPIGSSKNWATRSLMRIAKFFKSRSEAEELIRRQSADDPLIGKIFFHQFDMLDSLLKEDITDIVTNAQKISEATSQKSWWIQFIEGAFKKVDPKTYIKAVFCSCWTNFSELFQIGGLFSYNEHTFVNPFSDFAVSLDMKLLPSWTHAPIRDEYFKKIPTDSQRPRQITISPQPAGFEILSLLMGFDPENLRLHPHSD